MNPPSLIESTCVSSEDQLTLHSELIRFVHSLHLLRQTSSGNGKNQSAIPLLGKLAAAGPLRSRDLAERVFLDPSTVSRQVDALVKTGHVRRTVDPHDGRASLLEITPEGSDTLRAHKVRINQILHDMLSDWQQQDIDRFVELLHRLNDDASAYLPTMKEQIRSTNLKLATATGASKHPTPEERTA